MPDLCDGLDVLARPICAAGDAALGAVGSAAGSALDAVGETFARGAEAVLDAVFEAISQSTTPDLGAGYVTRSAAALASVALVVVVALFVIQVVTSAVRREPGGLGRAVTGAAVAMLGTAVAATITQALLIAVDQVSESIADLAGTSIQGAARQLLDVTLLLSVAPASPGTAALLIVFGLLFILGATLTLGTLLVRQALIVVAVVVAPLAFAGGASRLTSGWVRRWVQVTLALILSKLAIVVVFVVAVGMVGEPTGLGGLLSGLILLLLACLAPWACFKVLDFAGTAVASEWHRATNGSTVAAVNQGRMTAQQMMRSAAPVVGGPAGAAAAVSGGGGKGTSSGSAAAGGSRPAMRIADAIPGVGDRAGADKPTGASGGTRAGDGQAGGGSGPGLWAVPPTAPAWQPPTNGRGPSAGTGTAAGAAGPAVWAVPPTPPAWQPPNGDRGEAAAPPRVNGRQS